MSLTKNTTNQQTRYLPLVQRALSDNPLFAGCGEATRAALLHAAQVRVVGKGERVSTCGQAVECLYLVLSGSLEVSSLSATGKRYVCWYLGPGQAYGWIPLIDRKGAIHDVRAHADSLLLELPRQPFMAAAAADPALMEAIMLAFCERSRTIHEALAAGALLNLGGRVADMLLRLLDSFGQADAAGARIGLKLSQEELADMLGVTRQSLNRELKLLEADGVISLAYSHIRVHDRTALQALAMQVQASALR